MTGTDWQLWHAGYDDAGSDLARRLRSVQQQVGAWLDDRLEPALRVVSACSGDGRDVLEVLGDRPADASRCRVRLLETDEALAAAAERRAAALGLGDVEVVCADAGATDSYRGAVPADLVMMCGVFGNVSDEHVRGTVAALPQLCAAGATVVWTRGRLRSGDLSPRIRDWFAESGFAEVALDAPTDATYRVGVHRLTAPPQPLVPGRRLFRFTR